MMFIVLTLLVLFIINVNDENWLVLMCLNKENWHWMIIDIEMKIDGITQEGKLTWVDWNKNDGL